MLDPSGLTLPVGICGPTCYYPVLHHDLHLALYNYAAYASFVTIRLYVPLSIHLVISTDLC